MTLWEMIKSQFIPVFVYVRVGESGFYRKRVLHKGYEKYRAECYIEYNEYYSIGFVDENFEFIKD
jgi:hypothetical protein